MDEIPIADETQLPPPSLDPMIPIEQQLPQSEYQDNKSDVFKEVPALVMQLGSQDGSGPELDELSESNRVCLDESNMEDNESKHEDDNDDNNGAENKEETPSLPIFGPPSLLDLHHQKWPNIQNTIDKLSVLKDGAYELRLMIESKEEKLTGVYLKWHQQILDFMELQIANIHKSDQDNSKLETPDTMSNTVASNSKGRTFVARGIRSHECSWIKKRIISTSRQGRYPKITCGLEHEGTANRVEEYIKTAGKRANYKGLVEAVTSYWKSLDDPEFKDRKLAVRTAQEWFKRMDYERIDPRKEGSAKD